MTAPRKGRKKTFLPKADRGPTVPTLRRHTSSNRAFCILDGRHVYFGKWGSASAKAEYGRVIAEWAANGCRLPVAQDEITVAEVVAQFLEHAAKRYRHPTTGELTSTFGEFRVSLGPVLDLYGHVRAVDFGPVALRAVRNTWIQPTEKREGLAIRTINSYTGNVRQMFKWAASHQLVPVSVHQALCTLPGLQRGRGEGRDTMPRQTVPLEDVEATIQHMPSPLRAIIRLLLLTGARPSEVLKLKRGDLDCAGLVWVAEIREHKLSYRGIKRTLYFGPRAQAILRPFLLRPDAAYLFSPREAEAERHADCKTHRRPNQPPNAKKTDRAIGECYDYTGLGKAIRRICDAHDIPRWTAYQLRHTACTVIEASADIEVARAILGHTDLATTAIYLHRDHKAAAAYAAVHG